MRLCWLLCLLVFAQAGAEELTVSPAALALRREYNEVAAAIDTLVRLYSAERMTRLADAESTPGAQFPDDAKLVLLIWADDEARIFLNGAPVGQTRLTPTRIEIPVIYLQAENVLTAQCWDTDRVESGFMAGLYVEDPSGLRPVLTTAEGQGWEVATGQEAGEAAQEIFYAHTQPDLPGARVMWGPQLFGNVDLRIRFAAADVTRAAHSAPATAILPRLQQQNMEFHESVARLVGLQERRRELLTRLSAGATRMDPYLRARRGTTLEGLSYTLGQAAPLEEATDLTVEKALSQWTRQLPVTQQKLVLHEARALRGPQAATAAAPMAEAAATEVVPGDRRTDYRPPTDLGTPGKGRGEDSFSNGKGRPVTAVTRASDAFMWRMSLSALLLFLWTGVHCWRGWRLWHAVHWSEEALKRI